MQAAYPAIKASGNSQTKHAPSPDRHPKEMFPPKTQAPAICAATFMRLPGLGKRRRRSKTAGNRKDRSTLKDLEVEVESWVFSEDPWEGWRIYLYIYVM